VEKNYYIFVDISNKCTITIQSLIALSGLNLSTLSDCSWMVRRSFSVEFFILPLLFPLQSFIAEKVHSLFTDVGGRHKTTSIRVKMLFRPWPENVICRPFHASVGMISASYLEKSVKCLINEKLLQI
jgi:hypothetical protein